MFYLPIEASKGQETTITVVQKLVLGAKIDVVIAWGAAAAGTAYGLLERRKRNKERAEKDARIASLEKTIDPNRTSSGVTPGGERKEKA